MILTLLLKSKFKILQYCQKYPVTLQNTFLKYIKKNKISIQKINKKSLKYYTKKAKCVADSYAFIYPDLCKFFYSSLKILI